MNINWIGNLIALVLIVISAILHVKVGELLGIMVNQFACVMIGWNSFQIYHRFLSTKL